MSLDPHPTPAQLRALAEKRGVLPSSVAQAPPKRGKAPSVRPWAPYRSKWEAEYAKRLDVLKACRLIESWHYEPDRLLIGVGAVYTPDFLVITVRGEREYHEVKGFRREAAMVRLKVAALAHPDERFVLVTKRGGEWHHTPIGAPGAPTTETP